MTDIKNVIIFYGQMGSGKSYRARNFCLSHHDFTFLEGDDYLSSDMKELVSSFKSFSPDMIVKFITDHLGPAIVAKTKNNNVVVAQALYRREHRKILQTYLESHNIHVEFILVKTSLLTNLKQLRNRPQGLRWIMYHLLNKPFFQEK